MPKDVTAGANRSVLTVAVKPRFVSSASRNGLSSVRLSAVRPLVVSAMLSVPSCALITPTVPPSTDRSPPMSGVPSAGAALWSTTRTALSATTILPADAVTSVSLFQVGLAAMVPPPIVIGAATTMAAPVSFSPQTVAQLIMARAPARSVPNATKLFSPAATMPSTAPLTAVAARPEAFPTV